MKTTNKNKKLTARKCNSKKNVPENQFSSAVLNKSLRKNKQTLKIISLFAKKKKKIALVGLPQHTTKGFNCVANVNFYNSRIIEEKLLRDITIKNDLIIEFKATLKKSRLSKSSIDFKKVFIQVEQVDTLKREQYFINDNKIYAAAVLRLLCTTKNF